MNAYEINTEFSSLEEYKSNLKRISNRNSLAILFFLIATKLLEVVSYFSHDFLKSLIEKNEITQNTLSTIIKVVGYGYQYLIVVPIAIWIAVRGSKTPSLRDCFKKPQMSAGEIFKWTVMSIGMIYALNYILTFLAALIRFITGFQANQIMISASEGVVDKVITFVVIAVLAPIMEESLFRGALVKNSISYGGWMTAIVSGIMFGLLHQNNIQTFAAGFGGVLIAFAVIKSKSIITGIIIHFVLNFIGAVQTVILSFVDMEGYYKSDNPLQYIMDNIKPFAVLAAAGLFCLGLAVAGVILFLIQTSQKNRFTWQLDDSFTEISTEKKLLIYFSAPVTILTVLLLIASTIRNALM